MRPCYDAGDFTRFEGQISTGLAKAPFLPKVPQTTYRTVKGGRLYAIHQVRLGSGENVCTARQPEPGGIFPPRRQR